MGQTNQVQGRFYLGCAVWAYKNWIGEFYPPGSRSSNFLHLYSHRFTTVEGNTTFYAIPNAETVTRWASQTPSEFKFCLKLPRDLTHQGQLQPAISGALEFLEQMSPLGSRLGPFFAQLPPNYSPENFEDLKAFLTAWPRHQAALALEVRHLDWFQEPHASELKALLTELGVGRVLLDSQPIYSGEDDPQLHSERRKPKVPLQFSVTAPFSLIRFISHPQLSVNQTFIQDWIPRIQQSLSQGTDVFFFVHCPVEERSPAIARSVQHLLEQHQVPVPPLPWNQLDSSPIQLTLW